MNDVFKYSDEILTNEYPELELTNPISEDIPEYDFVDEEIIEDDLPVEDEASADAEFSSAGEAVALDIDPVVEELKKNNDYWEMFLDSYETVHHYDISFQNSVFGWKFVSNGSVSFSSGPNDRISYVPVVKNQLYYVSSLKINGSSSTDIRCGVVDNLDNPSLVTNFRTISYSSLDDFNFVAGQDGYLCFWHNPRVVEGVLSYDISSFDSYTLSELGNAVIVTQQKVDVISTLLLVAMVFLFARAVVKKLFWRFK